MDRMRLALECAEIDEAGGSVRAYLASKGFISPWGTWYRLQIEELGRKNTQITEGKGGHDMRKVTLEQKKEAVKIALGGGDPLAYLKGIGSKQPSALWWTIKKGLQEADPEAYAKLTGGKTEAPKKGAEEPKPLDGGGWEPYKPDEIRKNAEVVLDEIQKHQEARLPESTAAFAADAQDLRPGFTSRMTMEANGNVRMEVGRPLDKMGIKVTGLITPFGEFQTGGGMLAWYKDGNLITERMIEEWKKLLETLPVVMEIMNI